jgi:hypothetical protein
MDMFSKLGPIFKTGFRKTEETDTRQAIRIDERKDTKKKSEFEEKPKTPDEMWEDSTVVSTDNLMAFLKDFLSSLPEEETGNSEISANNVSDFVNIPDSTDGKIADIKPKDKVTEKAVNAYKNAYTHSPEYVGGMDTVNSHPAGNMDENAKKELGLDSSDHRTIHKLISDLKDLSENGVHQLNILKEGTFLESIALAVERAKMEL